MGWVFHIKSYPTLVEKDLRGCVFYNCYPKLENKECVQIKAIASVSEYNKTLELEGANLGRADLTGANLTGANLQTAGFSGGES